MSSESNFSATTKVGGDLFTVRGDTVEQFVANLDAAVNAVGSFVNLQGVANAIHGTGPGTTVVSQPAPAAAPVAPFAPQQPAQVTQSGVPTPSCHHGQKVWRVAKPPKTWKGWFCPSPQGTPDQCSPVFEN